MLDIHGTQSLYYGGVIRKYAAIRECWSCSARISPRFSQGLIMSARSESGDRPPKTGRSSYPLPSTSAFTTMDGDLDLDTITDAIDAGRPLPEILDLVVDRAYLLLDAAETFILLREGDVLVGCAQRGFPGAASEIRIPLGESIEGQVAARRRP